MILSVTRLLQRVGERQTTVGSLCGMSMKKTGRERGAGKSRKTCCFISSLTRLALAPLTASGSSGLRLSPTGYSGLRQDMCSWFVFKSQRNTGVRASAESSFPWPAKRPGGWARTNCIFRRIPQKSHRRHTGHLAVRLRRRSMRDWQQRSPLMSKWNIDYKSSKEKNLCL